MQPPEQQTDLRHLLHVLWRRKLVIILTLITLPVATYLVSKTAPKTYETSVQLQVQPSAVDTSLFESGGTPVATGAIAAAARLIETTPVAELAARRIENPPKDPRDLLGKIETVPDEDSGFITLTATDGDAQRAAEIANAFAAATVAARSGEARRRVETAIRALQEELQTRRGNATSRRQLSEQLQRLRALRAAQGNNAQVVQSAGVPGSPVSPKPVRNTTLAFVVAILLGVGLAFVVDRLDRRIRTAHELEEVSGLPLLTSIPTSAFPDNDPSGADSEAFQTLRASLTYFNVDRPVKMLIVASPSKGDGKTTVATNLAISVARNGKDVLLVDADLRRPQVAPRLGLEEGSKGLGAVLAGEATLEESLVDFHVAGGYLRVLPAGHPPPNPSELLGSERMRTVLEELKGVSDMVIVDSTPILPVSDVLPLLRAATGVVAVGRLNNTTTDAVRRFKEVVNMAGGHLLGIVATDSRGGGFYDGYGYGNAYGYGYGEDASDGGGRKSSNGRRGAKSEGARTS